MRNNKGSVMIITMGFILIFTLLGIASLHLAGIQNQSAAKRIFSTGAFWLADGAIQRAKSRLPGVLVNATGVAWSNGNYDIAVVTKGTSRWKATAKATVSNQVRTIEAEIANYDILDAITTTGTINDSCVPAGSAQINGNCVQGAQFTFESVFNGLSKQDIKNLATLYDNFDLRNIPKSNTINSVTGVTFVTFQGNKKESLHVPTNSSGSGFLIIDASGNTNTVTFDVTGGVFNGIIWLIGNNVSMTGNPNINGAIFIDASNQDTKLGGTATVTFSSTAVAGAISDIGSTLTSKKPTIVSWREI